MQVHEYSFEIDAPREEVWAVMHRGRPADAKRGADTENPRVIEHNDVRIEILCEGDENGDGLVRHCWFRVPRLLLSGGRAQSWELVSQVRPPEYSRYDAIGKPLWSKALGWHRMDDLGNGRTLVVFHEEYHVFNPVLRFLLERYVHKFISRDNDVVIKGLIEEGIKANRLTAAADAKDAEDARSTTSS